VRSFAGSLRQPQGASNGSRAGSRALVSSDGCRRNSERYCRSCHPCLSAWLNSPRAGGRLTIQPYCGDMRGLCLLACLGVVFALPLNSTVQAAIRPIPRPDAPKPVRSPKPNTHPAVQHQAAWRQPVRSPSVATRTPAPRRRTPARPRRTPAPVVSRGGHVRRPFAPAVSRGGHIHPALPRARSAEIVPTRLAEVGHESLPSHDAWPSWLLAVLALLASAESFLLVRLARPLRVPSPSSAPSAAHIPASKPHGAAAGPPPSPERA
jgi:hypothetical protein